MVGLQYFTVPPPFLQESTGIHWNPQEWDRNEQESTGMGPVKSSIPATVLVEYGRTWNPVGILHSSSI